MFNHSDFKEDVFTKRCYTWSLQWYFAFTEICTNELTMFGKPKSKLGKVLGVGVLWSFCFQNINLGRI